MIQIKVIYATSEQQTELPLSVAANCTVAQAIRRSGMLEQFPELNFAEMTVGIYGRKVALDASLCDGDRVEIYRPLEIDPKEARRLRAKSAKAKVARK